MKNHSKVCLTIDYQFLLSNLFSQAFLFKKPEKDLVLIYPLLLQIIGLSLYHLLYTNIAGWFILRSGVTQNNIGSYRLWESVFGYGSVPIVKNTAKIPIGLDASVIYNFLNQS